MKLLYVLAILFAMYQGHWLIALLILLIPVAGYVGGWYVALRLLGVK